MCLHTCVFDLWDFICSTSNGHSSTHQTNSTAVLSLFVSRSGVFSTCPWKLRNGFCLTDVVNNHNYLKVSFILARSPVSPDRVSDVMLCSRALEASLSTSKTVHDRKKISNCLIFNPLHAKRCSAGLRSNGSRLDNSWKALESTEMLHCWMRVWLQVNRKEASVKSHSCRDTVCLLTKCITSLFMLENIQDWCVTKKEEIEKIPKTQFWPLTLQ